MDPRLLLEALLDVVREPTANLTAAALLVALIALVVLIAVVALLLWATGGRRRSARKARTEPREKTAGAPAPAGRKVVRLPRRALGGLAVALTLGAALATHHVAGSQTYCAESCHHGERVLESMSSGPHATVACVACHEDRAAILAPGYTLLRVAHAASALSPAGPSYPVPPPTRACASCHSAALSGVVEAADRGVRMVHEHPVAAGMSCHECHEGVGHGQPSSVPMSRCLPCHDGRTAPMECGTCHIKEPGAAASSAVPKRVFGRVRLGPVEDCGGCHDQRACDSCHGIRMPHTTVFKEGAHAREAAFARKQKCWKCHDERQDCGRCHGDFNAHGEDFAQTHRTFDPDSPCDGCHRGHTGSFCDRCH